LKRKITLFSVVNTIILLGLVVVTLYPFVHMGAVSLSSSIHVLKGEVSWFPKGFQLETYKLVLSDPRIGKAYWNTIVYVTLGTAISLVITSLGAYALAKKTMLFHRGFTLVIIFTMFFGGGMIPTFLVVKELGVMDTVWGIVLPGAVSTWNLLIMRTFFSGIPVELEESGRIDGLNDIGVFFRIVVPLSQAVFATIGLFYAVGLANVSLLQAAIDKHRNEQLTRFILGERSLDQWDQYVAEANKLGLDELMKITQKAYDRLR